ncbi:MAG: DUF1845 domain-containing protein [Gammaproteobacteria bacterium]|nr:DUF1845 domain-containing protein [Gammaproteobacteria bacterium]MYF30055.1 DUF1845 domain-containing protein [Gammaproteobacteria bacterium]MYK46237.1 DUF1845 domain-containing protein [Gammaproteobacteria bacterium]
MSERLRVGLRTIAARQAWDGRKARVGRGFIPGIRHFQAGVRALRRRERAGDAGAAERLARVEADLAVVDAALVRWAKGNRRFLLEDLDAGAFEAQRPRWIRAARTVRVRTRETRRLAMLIAEYDAACAATVRMTAAAGKAGVFNAQHACIAERGREIRAALASGYSGVRYGGRRGAERGSRTVGEVRC